MARFDITLLAVPALLDSVKVVVNSRCSKRKDAAAAAALLQQARSGLLATIVARDSNPAAIVRLAFERRHDPRTNVPLDMRVRRDSASQATMAFKALHDGAWYVANGFREVLSKDGREYFYGPDAEVLLDDGFAAGYCFRIVDAPRERRGQIGLGFTESERSKDRVGIDGVLWVDTVARALRDIDYRYTGFQNLDALRPGGRTSFQEMKNGIVLTTSWMIRLPKRLPDTSRIGARMTVHFNFYAVEGGGEIVSARWPDSTRWEAPLARARVKARLRRSDTAAAGIYLRFAGTDYWAETDANGVADFKSLEPGPYFVTVADSVLVDLGLKPDTIAHFLAIRDSTVSTTVGIRRTAEYVLDRCLADHKSAAKDGLLLGRVVSTDGSPVKSATVSLRSPGSTDPVYTMTTGEDGMFSACFGSARRGETYTILARAPDGATDAQTRTFKDTVTSVKLVLDVAAEKAVASGPPATVFGVAWDSLHASPLAGALIGLSGSTRTTVTDSAGRFRIDSVAPGKYLVSTQHDAIEAIGMSSLKTRATIAGDGADTIHVALPSFATFWKSVCSGEAPSDLAMVYGMVTDTVGNPVEKPIKLGAEVKEGDTTRFLDRSTDSTGAYVFCGLSPKARVRIVVAEPGASGPIDLPPLETTRILRRDIAIKRPSPDER
jgi:hypothetical protein